MKTIILASASPRRRKLLEQIELKFKIDPSSYNENTNCQLKPHALAKYLSSQKVKQVAKRHKNAIIIAADTFIVLENEVLGKPQTANEASKILKKISGKSHIVITGFTIFDTDTNKTISKSVETKVYMKKLTTEEIAAYVASKEPLDKAGAYGIQEKGAVLVEKIDGDFYNVVGLPLRALTETLKEFGINIL